MFLNRIAEVAGSTITFAKSGDSINKEANANLHTFSLSQDEAGRVTVEQVADFVQGIIDAYEKQIAELYGVTHPMVFYCWFDEQASQLRFSMVSKFYGKLPFGSTLHHVKDLAVVLEAWLHSRYHDGIPFDEFEEVPLEIIDDQIFEQTQSNGSLDVWSIDLPRIPNRSISVD